MSKASDYSKIIMSLKFEVERTSGPSGGSHNQLVFYINEDGHLTPSYNSSTPKLDPKEALQLRNWLTEMFED